MSYYSTSQLIYRMDDQLLEKWLPKLPTDLPWLIPGGMDVWPEFYGETPTFYHGGNRDADEKELKVVRRLLEMGAPMLGVCRGHQLIAIAEGGTLYQDMYGDGATTAHDHGPVRITGDSLLAEIFPEGENYRHGNWLSANSLHHQAIKDTPDGWVVSARSADGIIEAIEHPDRPQVVSVQWHPEINGQFHKILDYLNQFTQEYGEETNET